jgi:hypothetical protein
MRQFRFLAITSLWLAPVWGMAGVCHGQLTGRPAATPTAVQPAPRTEGSCGKFGTQVNFVDTPSEAARQAAKEQKLVFVLHVSGLFEDPRFT